MSFADFMQTYAPTILYSVLVAVAGFLGAQAKRIWDRISADQTKKDVAETVVRAVEQMYKDLHGEEKKQKAVEGIRQMLDAKGVTIADIEIEMLLEAAVAEFNRQRTADQTQTPAA
ncbi:MAG: hypothetical protein IJT44_03550 [Clostridia bacterium]|nr:hypothetical protein [Clostridia bacterium]